uniref:Uncharacterized protein n=1 Tax=Mimivirus LCMiAC02 TaxID=2506609 RepID=A0A4D5XER5_9VIRU|nr:MAG: hypothetical protein LCMiAC02_03340 [Mimivirus LCMiAC02]
MNSVELNKFSLKIITDDGDVDKIMRNGSNYYALPDRTEYKLKLGNYNNVKADAHVWIDGEKVGVWRLKSYSNITIERPAKISRKFTLLKENSRKARNAGITRGKAKNGLIKVVFKPEKKYNRWQNDSFSFLSSDFRSDNECYHNISAQQCMSNSNYNCNNFSSGATTLGDDSYQRFDKVESIDEIDHNLVTTLYARLIIDNNTYMYRKPYIGLRQALNTVKYPSRITDF